MVGIGDEGGQEKEGMPGCQGRSHNFGFLGGSEGPWGIRVDTHHLLQEAEMSSNLLAEIGKDCKREGEVSSLPEAEGT